jgi:hypothetical protein
MRTLHRYSCCCCLRVLQRSYAVVFHQFMHSGRMLRPMKALRCIATCNNNTAAAAAAAAATAAFLVIHRFPELQCRVAGYCGTWKPSLHHQLHHGQGGKLPTTTILLLRLQQALPVDRMGRGGLSRLMQ